MFKIDDNKNITIVRGDSAVFEIELLEEDEDGEKTPYEFQEGDYVVFTVKKSVKTSEIILQKLGPTITIDPYDTQYLDYGNYKYDVQFTRGSDGYVDTVIPPKNFKITEEVTW